jgi:hypothetical protein
MAKDKQKPKSNNTKINLMIRLTPAEVKVLDKQAGPALRTRTAEALRLVLMDVYDGDIPSVRL